jgi:shikimate dehydrogenase
MRQGTPPAGLPITGRTHLVGLLGWPVEHSISPPMHNAAFASLGMDWCYLPFAVAPEALADALRGARALGLRGLNATVPHKQALLALVDDLTPEARAIGAVNTLLFGERLTGHNTDAAGFMRALREAGGEPRGCRALVLGAGGAARAVGYGLAAAGARLTLLNRTPERAVALAADLGAALPQARVDAGPLTADALARLAPGVDLVVNTTSVGMWPESDATPWPAEVDYPAGALLLDLIYNPPETRLMASARSQGARADNGLKMLVHQGAEAFRLWTGVEPPVGVMLDACLAALRGDSDAAHSDGR